MYTPHTESKTTGRRDTLNFLNAFKYIDRVQLQGTWKKFVYMELQVMHGKYEIKRRLRLNTQQHAEAVRNIKVVPYA